MEFSLFLSFSSFLILNQTRLLHKIYFLVGKFFFILHLICFWGSHYIFYLFYWFFGSKIFVWLSFVTSILFARLFLWITFLSYLCPFSCVPTRTTVILVWKSSLKLNFFNGFLKSIFWMRCFTLVWSRHTNSILY